VIMVGLSRLQAFSLVFVSEIGDKTFFIAGLLAMKTSRLISFTGSMAALTVMTIISVVIGQVRVTFQGVHGELRRVHASWLTFMDVGMIAMDRIAAMPTADRLRVWSIGHR
jgi:putative Ca2+/H+ antiporter (TMEM165/GDT1 family)